jgi:hypothetical protein
MTIDQLYASGRNSFFMGKDFNPLQLRELKNLKMYSEIVYRTL